MIRLEMRGDSEFFDDLEAAFESMPDLEDEALKKAANKFKTETRKKARARVKTDRRLTSGFYTEEKRGTGTLDAYALFYGENNKPGGNPHWHLIEEGHDIVRPKKGRNGHPTKDPGAILGHVEGIHVVDEVASEFGKIMEDAAFQVINKAAEEGRL